MGVIKDLTRRLVMLPLLLLLDVRPDERDAVRVSGHPQHVLQNTVTLAVRGD